MDFSNEKAVANKPRRSVKTLSVLKTLTKFTKQDLEQASPLSVTYVSNKKARIVKYDRSASLSTEEE